MTPLNKLIRMTISAALLLFISILMPGCSADESDIEIKIRISNVSKFDFQNVMVNTGAGNVGFGNVKSGQKSDYKTFESAYRYAFVELQIDGETYTIQPIDYVGETLLNDGNYSYKINASDSQKRYEKLTLILMEE